MSVATALAVCSAFEESEHSDTADPDFCVHEAGAASPNGQARLTLLLRTTSSSRAPMRSLRHSRQRIVPRQGVQAAEGVAIGSLPTMRSGAAARGKAPVTPGVCACR
jgi:hypothetical protein